MMTPAQRIDLLRAACCIANADGTASESEMVLVQKLIKEVGVGRASVDAMMARAKIDPTFCEDQFKILKSDPSESMLVLLQVAMADGKLTEEEIRVLQSLANNLEVPADVFDKLIAQVKDTLSQS
jgi:uncharacterized tellurite resistance protein B-like protein